MYGLSLWKKTASIVVYFASMLVHILVMPLHYLCHTSYRQQHTPSTVKRCSKFSLKTATGVLRRHLNEIHADAWISGCDLLRIPITAKEAQNTVAAYRSCHRQDCAAGSTGERSRVPFCNEAFVDAIVELIVSEDLVGLVIL
jgi:hypothetical protein